MTCLIKASGPINRAKMSFLSITDGDSNDNNDDMCDKLLRVIIACCKLLRGITASCKLLRGIIVCNQFLNSHTPSLKANVPARLEWSDISIFLLVTKPMRECN